MIRLENVTFRYNDSLPPALLSVSLEIKQGESVCVMGANGSGKSTFAKLVAGLIKNQQGRFAVQAESSTALPVGLLFQNPDNQMVALTVEKEIAFALENQGANQSEMERRIANVLHKLSISHLCNRLTTELSVGEKQRVALAAVLVSEPSILVLDEPDSYLDKDGKLLFRQLLNKLKEHDPELTIIEITQYPDVARSYERLILFHQGRVAADSTPTEILNNKNLGVKYGTEFSGVNDRQLVVSGYEEKNRERLPTRITRITMDRVSFAYPGGEDEVIKHFSSEFNASEITAIVGPSGCGKSTLGMLLCGINQTDEGSIKYSTESGGIFSADKQNGNITASVQQPERQFFLHTAQQEVEFAPQNFNRPVTINSVKEFFNLVGLSYEQFNQRDPFTLSLGEKRRLAFAAVLSILPDFIIFDEPTCALDQEGVGRFISLARVLKKVGAGVILISHDDDIVKILADKVIALDSKRNFWVMSKDDYMSSESPKQAAIPQK